MSGRRGTAFQRIYDITRQIPCGSVTTYGRIAAMAGNPRMSRIVGGAMHTAPEDVPCYRVVSRWGGLSDAFRPMGKDTHRLLLEMEGVTFRADGTADLERHLWDGPDSEKV